jgi:hypothetical protein
MNADRRLHLELVDSPIDTFREKLLDRRIMAMRQHARWAARRIAFTLSQQYAHGEIRFVTPALMNSQLRMYQVDSAVFKYGRKVISEKLKEHWS